MSKFKGTPGPWYATGATVYALNEDGFNRFSALVQDPRTEVAELKANARLMSASPKMLAALGVVHLWINAHSHGPDAAIILDIVDDAIASALMEDAQ